MLRLTIGIATVVIGLLPTMYQIGFGAGLLAIMLPGLGSAANGPALAVRTPRQTRFDSMAQLGAPIGFFLANGFNSHPDAHHGLRLHHPETNHSFLYGLSPFSSAIDRCTWAVGAFQAGRNPVQATFKRAAK